MFTFSQMVDEMLEEVKRPDLVAEVPRYLNQTIRECHADPENNRTVFFKENLRELRLTASKETGYSWDIPNPTTFQKMSAVRYPNQFTRFGEPVWPKETIPGRHINQLDYYYYQTGPSFVFAGYGGLNAPIDLSYFEFPASCKYYSVATRPAWYDEELGWQYADAVNTDELKAAARILMTNWLLMRWNTVISEGLRAKVYKRTSDTERARTSYSLYAQLREGLVSSESAMLGGVR